MTPICLCTLILYIVAVQYVDYGENKVIEIKNGKIEGKIRYTVEQNRTYYSFTKIPFAKPPVGELRFEAPQAAENWQGILPTVDDPPPCIQSLENGDIIGDENCLFVNVYTPKKWTENESLLPVMVWVFGGQFEVGSSEYNKNSPDYFLDQNVVFVTFNYRLGLFGFLSLNDTVAPGNYGLKDQSLAFRWVKENINRFGGDPEMITIFGFSAGSASVSYHLQSPLSDGLFNRVILESGTSLCLWSYSRVAPQMTRKIARTLDIDIKSSKSILSGLKAVNATYLHQKSRDVYDYEKLLHNPTEGSLFAPVRESPQPGAFFTGRSYELLSSGQYYRVPVLMGYNSFESFVTITNLLRLFLLKFDLLPGNFVPFDMNIKDKKRMALIGSIIKNHYFGLTPVALSDYEILRFTSDDQFVRPIQKFARLLSKYSPTYLYYFDYQGRLGGINNRTFPGVVHGEETGYLFRNNNTASPNDLLTRKRMIRLWTNFAKYGNPTPVQDELLENQKWLTIDPRSENVNYLKIGLNLTSSINPDELIVKFWEKLYDKFGVPPFDTY